MLGAMKDSRGASQRPSVAVGKSEGRGEPRRRVLDGARAADPPRRDGPPSGPPRTPNDPARDAERGLATKQRPKTDRPPRFKVLLYNDDYTPMEFVVQVLEKVFGKSPSAATQIMLQIHRSGMGVAGVYVLEVAETKSATVLRMAEERGYPLRSGVEKE
jgi:ATP-dependent Clp protease adaptor protein ClpS